MMSIDENLFFREATLRLCSSLDIKMGLKHCYDYIRTFIPVMRMGLDLVDLEENTLEFVAHVGADMGNEFQGIFFKIHKVQAHAHHWYEGPDVIIAVFQAHFDIEAAAQAQGRFAEK